MIHKLFVRLKSIKKYISYRRRYRQVDSTADIIEQIYTRCQKHK